MKQTLRSLLHEIELAPNRHEGEGGLISDIRDDSRQVGPGCLFVCNPSATRDTHDFLESARVQGAAAVLVHSGEGFDRARAMGLEAAWLNPFHSGCSLIAQEIFGQPSQSMEVIGVTGTNGKTTTAWLIRDALRVLGKTPAYMGTLGFDAAGQYQELANTTPFPTTTAQIMAEAAKLGCSHFSMEASSHALAEDRIAGVVFDAAIFTNLTQDHLDFHGSMEAYEAAKLRLFTDWASASRKSGKEFTGAMNIGDPIGAKWAQFLTGDLLTYGSEGADLTVTPMEIQVGRMKLRFDFRGESAEVQMRIGGLFNVWNASSSMAGLLALGFDLAEAAAGLAGVSAVPGRFEAIENGLGIGVIVDYAHTPDALEQLLKSARGLDPKRIITVFGCGGDRDRSKRPKMAAVVGRASDVAVVTSDNPRTEDPAAILADVVAGLPDGAESRAIIDRSEAIHAAIAMAQPGDLVVIAGKGHEDYQIIGRTKHPMDDRELARQALAAR